MSDGAAGSEGRHRTPSARPPRKRTAQRQRGARRAALFIARIAVRVIVPSLALAGGWFCCSRPRNGRGRGRSTMRRLSRRAIDNRPGAATRNQYPPARATAHPGHPGKPLPPRGPPGRRMSAYSPSVAATPRVRRREQRSRLMKTPNRWRIPASNNFDVLVTRVLISSIGQIAAAVALALPFGKVEIERSIGNHDDSLSESSFRLGRRSAESSGTQVISRRIASRDVGQRK